MLLCSAAGPRRQGAAAACEAQAGTLLQKASLRWLLTRHQIQCRTPVGIIRVHTVTAISDPFQVQEHCEAEGGAVGGPGAVLLPHSSILSPWKAMLTKHGSARLMSFLLLTTTFI